MSKDCLEEYYNEKKLKESLVEFYNVVVELDGITEDYEWWREPENISRVEKLTKDRDKLVEKINKMLKQEEALNELYKELEEYESMLCFNLYFEGEEND